MLSVLSQVMITDSPDAQMSRMNSSEAVSAIIAARIQN